LIWRFFDDSDYRSYRQQWSGISQETLPSAKVLEEWAAKGFPLPQSGFVYEAVDAEGKGLQGIPYKELNLSLPWDSFDISHELTRTGSEKFVADYESTLKRSA